MKIFTVVGNRPQFVKAAAVSDKLRAKHEEILVHTGQHYDEELSATFFRELGLPQPDFELATGSGTQALQTAAILTALEPVVIEVDPDLLLVYGDTNSTLAGALVGAKLGVPVAHVEAGMRSFDRAMPEEINRVVADHCADLLLCSSETAVENLRSEGIERNVELVGDVMLDVALRFGELAEARSDVLDRLELVAKEYLLVTAHRAGNVDDPEQLRKLIKLLAALPKPAIFPVHPRTERNIKATGLEGELNAIPGLTLLPPVGYLDFMKLLRGARALLTDSGGAQKEAYLFSIPCVTLRETTEWVETVELGWNTLAGLNTERALKALAHGTPSEHPELYGRGHAAERLVQEVGDFGRASRLRNVQ